jgi:hypothetical protein
MKRRVVLDRPKLETSQIKETQDFSFVLSQVIQYNAKQIPFYKKGWFITTVASFIGFVSISLALLN